MLLFVYPGLDTLILEIVEKSSTIQISIFVSDYGLLIEEASFQPGRAPPKPKRRAGTTTAKEERRHSRHQQFYSGVYYYLPPLLGDASYGLPLLFLRATSFLSTRYRRPPSPPPLPPPRFCGDIFQCGLLALHLSYEAFFSGSKFRTKKILLRK